MPGDLVKKIENMNHLVSAYNNFSFRLFAEILFSHSHQDKVKSGDPAWEQGENVFFSPLSIATDLAMFSNGATDENRQAIARIMGIKELKREAFNPANAALQTALEKSLQKIGSDALQSETLYSCVNALWRREEGIFASEFEAINQKIYHTEVESLSDDPYGDTAIINGWVSSQTKYLPAILNDIYPHATCFILNTLFFKRDWYWTSDFFQKNRGIFNSSKSQPTECMFFSPVHPLSLPYYKSKYFEAVCIPYQENRKCIYFFLPEHLTDFLQNHLNYENWQKWMSEFSMTNGEIHLPRINIECETNLDDLVSIPDLHMRHRAFLKLFPCSRTDHNVLLCNPYEKKGTENEKEDSAFKFIADRPFFCVIQDEETGLILFMGCIGNPLSVLSDKKVSENIQVVCVSDDTECFDIGLESAADNTKFSDSDSESVSDDTGDLDLNLENIIEYDEKPVVVESKLPEYIDTEMMHDIETEIDNNLRELYEVYKNGEAEPSDCIAGASSCITLCDETMEEAGSDETDLEDIDLDGLELDLLEEELEKLEDKTLHKEDVPYIRHKGDNTLKSDFAALAQENSEDKLLHKEDFPSIRYKSNLTLESDFANLVQKANLETAGWVPLFKSENKIVVAIDEPDNKEKTDAINAFFPNKTIELRIAFKEDILGFVRHFGFIKNGRIFGGRPDESLPGLNTSTIEKELKIGIEAWELPITRDMLRLVGQIIQDAYFQNVTDIHIECQSETPGVMVRGRIDGACRDYPFFIPSIFGYPIVSCIKKMAGLNIAERLISQTGSIRFQIEGEDILLQVVTYPTQEGTEDAVMRFLKYPERILLHEMGFSKSDYQSFIDCIHQPYGIILISGPDSDITFHAALNTLNKRERKIFTAEYPIKVVHKEIRQLRLNPEIGFDKTAALQTILQADPDIIGINMDGWEEKEILNQSIYAARTGRLVLLRCDSYYAPSSILEIISKMTESSEISDVLLCLLSQRMVRTLCKYCKEPYAPSKKEFDELVRHYGKADFEKNPPEYPNGESVRYSGEMILYRRKGCALCSGGYQGQMAVNELLVGTPEIKKLIQTEAGFEAINAQAVGDGMRTLKQDAIAKIFAGYIDLAQVKKFVP